MKIKQILRFVLIGIVLFIYIGANSCNLLGGGGGCTCIPSSPSYPNNPPISNYINSIYITNQNNVSVPGSILEYGVNYNLVIKFSVPIAQFFTNTILSVWCGTQGGNSYIINLGPGNISLDGLTVIVPLLTPQLNPYLCYGGLSDTFYTIGINSPSIVLGQGTLFITTKNSINYNGNVTNKLAGSVSFNIWLNNLGSIFPWIASFTPGYPNTIQRSNFPPSVPVSGYFPPHSPINVVFSEVMMGGTNLPISMLYERDNASGSVFTPSEIPEINFSRSDDRGITVLLSNSILEPGSEYKFTFLSAGNLDLYHSMYGNQDTSGMPLYPYVNSTNCASGDKACIDNAYWTAIKNGIPNDIRAFNTSLVRIETPSYPAFSGFNYRNAIYVTPTSMSLNVTGSTTSAVSALQFSAQAYPNGITTQLGSTGVTNNKFSASVSFAGLADGPYYFVAKETTNGSYDYIPVYKDTIPPSAPSFIELSSTDMSIDDPSLNSVCATANARNIKEARLYIVGPHNSSIYITSVTLPDNLTSSQEYQFCFSNVTVPFATAIYGDEFTTHEIPIAGIYNVQIRFVDFGGLEGAAGIAHLKVHPVINYVYFLGTNVNSSKGCPGTQIMILGNGFDPTNSSNNVIKSSGMPWSTWNFTYYFIETLNYALGGTVPNNAVSGYLKVVTNGVESINSKKFLVPRSVDKYVDSGYTPIGISMALDKWDKPMIAATDGYNLYFRYWDGSKWASPTKTPIDYAYPPANAHSWTLGIAPKISLALDSSGNPAIAYAKAMSLSDGTPAVGIYYAKGINNGDGTYSFPSNSISLVDTITPCQNVGSYGFLCDPRWLDSNYSINLVFDTNPPPLYTAFTGAPIISYRSGNYTGSQVLKTAEIVSGGRIGGIDIETVANTLDAPTASCDWNEGIPMWGAQDVSMNKDQYGNIGLIYNLAYCDNYTGPNQSYIYYIQRTTDANGSITWQNDISNTNYSSASPSSLIINNGNPMFALNSEGYERIFENTGGSSWNSFTIDTTHTNSASTSLGFNSNNNRLAVSYYDYANKTLKMANGNIWLPNIADIGIDVGKANAIAIDSAGNADIAYSDNYNGRLLFFQEANGNFVATDPSYNNNPTSCDANKFEKVTIPVSTINSLAGSLETDTSINLPFPLNIFALSRDDLSMFLLGALHEDDIITIDQSKDPASYTIKFSAPSDKYLDSADTIDITLDLNALNNTSTSTLSISADFMDNYDTLFSSIPHNISLIASSSRLNIVYTVNVGPLGLYGGVNINTENGTYVGLPYGFNGSLSSCPSGSIISNGVCNISNVTLQNFLSSFFPTEMGLVLGSSIASHGVDLQQTVAQYFSNNTNILKNMFGGHLMSLLGKIKLPNLLKEIKQNGNGYNPSHAHISLSGLHYSLYGNGIHQGAIDFKTNTSIEVWGTYKGADVRVTCGGSNEGLHFPIVPNIAVTDPITTQYINTHKNNLFIIDHTFIPGFDGKCSYHIAGTFIKWGIKFYTTFIKAISIHNISGQIQTPISAAQWLTYQLLNGPLYLTTSEELDSMVISTNGLDVYMESK